MHLHPRTRELLNGISPGSAEACLGDLVLHLVDRVTALEAAAAATTAPAETSTTPAASTTPTA